MELKPKALEQIKEISTILDQFQENGASLEQIMAAIDVPRRTLQRRLEQMQERVLVTVIGEGKATRYRLIEVKEEKGERTETISWLSKQSKSILAEVSKPASTRLPVGYHREFLEMYQPNITNYLTSNETQKLLQVGQTTGSDQTAGTYAKEILQRLLIDLSYNSSRLEGNTYSLLDTERLINLGEVADNKSAMEAQMILNHKDAIEFIVQSAEEIDFNRYTILNLHALFSNNLLPDPAASGRLRRFGVGIGKSVNVPLGIPQVIEEMFELLLEKVRQILNPFEQAFFILVQLPYLQPFEDVNKRVSRIAANIPLNRSNLAPLSFVDVPNDLYISGLLAVYELNQVELLKDVFIWSYERSAARYAAIRQSLGEPDLFRLKYRQAIRELVVKVLSKRLDKKSADEHIKKYAVSLPEKDRMKFVEYVETELLTLHDGNFARYMISPSEFAGWKETWL